MISHWLDYSALQQYNPIAMSGLCRRGALLKANNITSNSSPKTIQKRNSSCEMLPPSEFTSPSLFAPFPLYFHLEDFYFLEFGRVLDDFQTHSNSFYLIANENCTFPLYMVFPQMQILYVALFSSVKTISVILLNRFL